VVTGGLGPTEDDLTRLAVSRAMGRPLVYHPILARNLFDYITARGYNFSENNYRQSWLPDGCALVENPWGTAPAFCQEARNRVMLFTPGVPQEMKNIVEYFLGPKLEEKFPSRLGYHRTTILRASGLGESRVDYLLGDLIRDSVNPVLGLLAGPYETRILITSKARDKAEADRLEAPIIAEAIKRLGPNYVGRDGQTMVTSVCEVLKNQSLRLGIIDGVTFGEAAQTFLKLLPPQNLAGTLEVAADGLKVKEGTDFLFNNMGADLVGILSYPESFLSQGTIQDEDTEITVNIRLLKRNPTEELPIEVAQDTILVGRTKAAALSRASALLALKLYTYLRNLPY
jgi:molybdopterin-biosynthesis enzyme MoeA-like protein